MAAERYARITRRMWNDEKFRALSRPKPNAQSLWIFLLTAPTRGGVPGLLPLGELSLAEAIDWPVTAVRKHLAELEEAKFIRADRAATLIFIPKAIKHNAPESPNVVLSWAAAWRELPECALRSEAQNVILDFLLGHGESFAEAFRQVLEGRTPKPSGKAFYKSTAKGEGKPSLHPSGKGEPNQSQSQSQSQSQTLAPDGDLPDPETRKANAARLRAMLASPASGTASRPSDSKTPPEGST